MNTNNIILLTAALAFSVFTISQAQAQDQIKGGNVTIVMYQDPDTGKDVQINMDPNDRSKWFEHSPNGPFTFKAANRDEWSVYLWDETRAMAMQIDLHTKKITYGGGSANGQVTSVIGTYPIKHAQ